MIRNLKRILAVALVALMLTGIAVPGHDTHPLRQLWGVTAAESASKKAAAGYFAYKSLRSINPKIHQKLLVSASSAQGRKSLAGAFRKIVGHDRTRRLEVLSKLKEIRNDLKKADGLNKTAYQPRLMEKLIASRHKVERSTLPPTHMPNVKNAGRSVEVSGHKIPFDNRGFPIFDAHAKYDTRIPKFDPSAGRNAHFAQATRDLRDAIKRGEIPKGTFNEQQTKAIMEGSRTIPNHTWHHHQDRGRMQLVPDTIHSKLSHVGGHYMNK